MANHEVEVTAPKASEIGSEGWYRDHDKIAVPAVNTTKLDKTKIKLGCIDSTTS